MNRVGQSFIKGSDRLYKVVELSMECCGSVNPEFERKFDDQNSYFGGANIAMFFSKNPPSVQKCAIHFCIQATIENNKNSDIIIHT